MPHMMPHLRRMTTLFTLLLMASSAVGQDASPPAAADAAKKAPHTMVTWARMVLGTRLPGTVVERTGFVINSGADPVTITAISPGSDAVSIIGFEPVVVRPSYAQPFTFVVRMPDKEGDVNESLTLQFDNLEPLTLPLFARVRHAGASSARKIGSLGAAPDPAIVPATGAGQWSDGEVWVFNRSSASVTIEQIKSSCACLKPVSATRFTLQPLQANRFRFQMEASNQFKRPSRKTLTFISNRGDTMRVLAQISTIPSSGAPAVPSVPSATPSAVPVPTSAPDKTP